MSLQNQHKYLLCNFHRRKYASTLTYQTTLKESKNMRPFQTSRRVSKSWLPSLKKSLFAGTILLSGGIVDSLSTPARASSNTETLAQQIAKLQAEQRELQRALASVQRQMVTQKVRRGRRGYSREVQPSFAGPATQTVIGQGNSALTARVAPNEVGAYPPYSPGAQETSALTNKGLITLGPGFFGTPDVETVTAQRDRDLTVRVAPNEVGIHPRQTAGNQVVSALGNKGIINIGPVTMILGGFVNVTMAERNRHLASDTFTDFNVMPFPNQPGYYTDNFSATARYSRISMLVRGNLNKHSIVSGYFEFGWGAAANTTNYYKSNSFTMRMRQIYLAYDNNKYGWHVLVGQAWTMFTPNRIGIVARQESLPITIDWALTAGTIWARQPQIRIVKDMFHHRLWAGISLENAANIYGIQCAGGDAACGTGTGTVTLPNRYQVTYGRTGQGLTNNSRIYPNEISPDVIGKLAWDPAWGHYEIEGMLTFPHTHTYVGNGHGYNSTAVAGGGGASMILPLIPHKMEMHLGGVVGKGIGRYGGAFLPGVTVNELGQPIPLFSAIASTGIVGHPTKTIDVYGYFGMQESGRSAWGNGQVYGGYGSPYLINAGCSYEGGTCQGMTHRIIEGTIGAWWRFFKGRFGTVESGVQLIYAQRKLWSSYDEPKGAKTDLSTLMLSFRYLPFQG